MNYKYVVSNHAKRDLDEIWIYSLHHWSLDQANLYYDLIIGSIEELCTNPELSKPLDNAKKGHRARLVKSHMIVFKIKNHVLYIDRILHQRMNIEAHLDD